MDTLIAVEGGYLTKTTDIAALREAALKATKGEWRAFTDIRTGTCAVHTPEDKGCGDIVDWPGFDSAAGSKKQKVTNAKFIAMANPATIIALLDQLDQLEAERQRAEEATLLLTQRNKLDNMRAIQLAGGTAKSRLDSSIALIQRVNELEAELAALKGEQEPFLYAVVKEKVTIGYTQTLGDADFMSLQHGGVVMPLFTRPSEPVVVLPKLHVGVVQAGKAVMTPYSGGHWLNKTAMIETLEAAGFVVKDGE